MIYIQVVLTEQMKCVRMSKDVQRKQNLQNETYLDFTIETFTPMESGAAKAGVLDKND